MVALAATQSIGSAHVRAAKCVSVAAASCVFELSGFDLVRSRDDFGSRRSDGNLDGLHIFRKLVERSQARLLSRRALSAVSVCSQRIPWHADWPAWPSGDKRARPPVFGFDMPDNRRDQSAQGGVTETAKMSIQTRRFRILLIYAAVPAAGDRDRRESCAVVQQEFAVRVGADFVRSAAGIRKVSPRFRLRRSAGH